jgi:ABC-type cobalamin transport system permease subunit
MAEEKQAPTQATYSRSIVATGNTVATPIVVAGVIGYLATVIQAIWPAFPMPTDTQDLYIGLAAAGALTWWSSFSIRGTQVTKE